MSTASHGYFKEHGPAEVRISYDFSPLVHTIESQGTKQWYEFVAKLFAVLGGIICVVGMTDKGVYSYVLHQKKKREGKLN